MDEFNKHFVRTHRQEIEYVVLNFFKCFDVSENESEYENEEQENIHRFSFLVFYMLCLIYYIPGILCDRCIWATKNQRTASISHDDDFDYIFIAIKECGWINIITDFITIELIEKFYDAIKNDTHEILPGFALLLDKAEKDKDYYIMAGGLNKGNEKFLKTKSKYLFAERICFLTWSQWYEDETGNNFFEDDWKKRNTLLWDLFTNSSWYSHLMQTDEKNLQEAINNVIVDYAMIKEAKPQKTLSVMIDVYIRMIKCFKEQDRYVDEIDDREHICGICFPQKKSDLEQRIYFAVDYLIANQYIQREDKNLCINIFRGLFKGKIQFFHGVSKNDITHKKEKGGNAVLYWILLYIREPLAFYGQDKSSFNYKEDISHFFFSDIEEVLEWKKIQNTGNKSKAVREEIKVDLRKKENEANVDFSTLDK